MSTMACCDGYHVEAGCRGDPNPLRVAEPGVFRLGSITLQRAQRTRRTNRSVAVPSQEWGWEIPGRRAARGAGSARAIFTISAMCNGIRWPVDRHGEMDLAGR